jgi:NADPH:quinone reductase-like Zn-dependent oxidoreductase
MRALRYDRYGSPDLLRLVDIPEPAAGSDRLTVRVRAVGLNPLDWKILRGDLRRIPLFASPPRGFGVDFAGTVTSGAAEGFGSGDDVFGSLSPFESQGAIAECVTVPRRRVARIPPPLDFVTAAALPIAAGTALQAIEDHAHVEAGQRVLVNGAAGGVGGFAVSLAKHFGAHVTGVCSAANANYVRALGADDVIDYRAQDFTLGATRYDVIFDAAATRSFGVVRRVLAPDGVYLTTQPSAASVAGAILSRIASRQRCVNIVLASGAAMWTRIGRLAAKGVLVPHIRRIPVDEISSIVSEMQRGHGYGKFVVDVGASLTPTR